MDDSERWLVIGGFIEETTDKSNVRNVFVLKFKVAGTGESKSRFIQTEIEDSYAVVHGVHYESVGVHHVENIVDVTMYLFSLAS